MPLSAFPDDGAAKRFGSMFKGLGYEIVTCGKTRDGEKRVVTIQDGNTKGKHVVIVDDLVQTGGTLFECGVALKNAGALSVSAFVAHGTALAIHALPSNQPPSYIAPL